LRLRLLQLRLHLLLQARVRALLLAKVLHARKLLALAVLLVRGLRLRKRRGGRGNGARGGVFFLGRLRARGLLAEAARLGRVARLGRNEAKATQLLGCGALRRLRDEVHKVQRGARAGARGRGPRARGGAVGAARRKVVVRGHAGQLGRGRRGRRSRRG
jgi:hypothetical protein